LPIFNAMIQFISGFITGLIVAVVTLLYLTLKGINKKL
jgi:hypothetical protein